MRSQECHRTFFIEDSLLNVIVILFFRLKQLCARVILSEKYLCFLLNSVEANNLQMDTFIRIHLFMSIICFFFHKFVQVFQRFRIISWYHVPNLLEFSIHIKAFYNAFCNSDRNHFFQIFILKNRI